MRIIYIDDFFHPDAGYQDNILSKYWVDFGHEVYIVTSEIAKIPEGLTKFFDCNEIEKKDRDFEQKYGVKIIRIPLITYKSGRSIYSLKIFRIIKEINPDVVFVNGNDSLIGMQLTWKNRHRYKYALVLDSHMLEMASQNPLRHVFRMFYKHFLTPIIIKKKIPIVRTQDDDYVFRCLGIPIEQCPWISFGTDTIRFHPDEEQRKIFREKYRISEDAFVVIYAGKLSENKGATLLAKATQMFYKADREIIFVIVGNSEGEYGEYVEKELRKAVHRIIRFPTQKYENLALFYQAADVAVYPKQCSLSFFDVQACGVPVIFENNNINIDRSKYGNAVTFHSEDLQSFTERICAIANMDKTQYQCLKENAITYINSNFKYKDKAKEYIKLFETVLNKNLKENRRNLANG